MHALAEENSRFEKDLKAVSAAKTTSGGVLDKKIVQMETDIRNFAEENLRIRGKIDDKLRKDKDKKTVQQALYDNFGEEDFDQVSAIKAKPRLFGDED